jgi:urease accessory protein
VTSAVAPHGVRAAARVVAESDGRGGTVLPVLRGDGPIAPRRTRSAPPWAEVTLVGAMSGPLGGDRLALSAEAGAGARLRVGACAATVALPGPGGERAAYDVDLAVGSGAELHWFPEPLIAAAGSDLTATTTVGLAADARLSLREILVLGRAGEPPGHLVTRLSVRLAGRPLLDQELALGPGEPGWSGPAVLDGHRAVGQLLVVDPGFARHPATARTFTHDRGDGRAVLTPLAGPAVLVTALAPDGLMVRQLMDEARALAVPGAP